MTSKYLNDPVGRFGHHPDPVIDFEVEIDAIAGMVNQCINAGGDKDEAFERIFRAMDFNVGGEQRAVTAKQALRDLESRLNRSTYPTDEFRRKLFGKRVTSSSRDC